ncbi:MAG: hypothetical protein AAF749_02500 [Pseudomonadota bacterium]
MHRSKRFRPLILFALLFGLLFSHVSLALTAKDFFAICASAEMSCSDHPITQAYIGGALDLMATLDEKTPYLEAPYCRPAKELFKVTDVVDYMKANLRNYESENAMLLFVRFLEDRGAC